jgi:hypothetical protein
MGQRAGSSYSPLEGSGLWPRLSAREEEREKRSPSKGQWPISVSPEELWRESEHLDTG